MSDTDPVQRVLRARRRAWRHDGFVYRGGADLLLRHGRAYRPRRPPDKHRHLVGPRNLCYRNAAAAALAEPALRYCEGVLVTGLAVHSHAWCLGSRGGVVEVTLPDEPGFTGWRYFGAVFAPELALEYMASIGAYSAPLLDGASDEDVNLPAGLAAVADDRDDWPILSLPYSPDRRTFGFGPDASVLRRGRLERSAPVARLGR